MADDTFSHSDSVTAKTSKTVTVKALKYHTAEGKEYQEGDTYDVDASKVDNLVAQGMVAPVE